MIQVIKTTIVFIFILTSYQSASAEAMKNEKVARTTIITASQRENSQSEKVGKFLENSLIQKGIPVSFINLYQEKLPLWEQPTKSHIPNGHKIWQGSIAPKLNEAEAIIIITPEYNGSASPAIKNFFLYPGEELAHKPILLIGVSAGAGGAYPLAELRSTSHKDTFAVFIPGNVIVREAKDKLNGPVPQNEKDKILRARLDYSLNLLQQYGLALKQVRTSGIINFQDFPTGQ